MSSRESIAPQRSVTRRVVGWSLRIAVVAVILYMPATGCMERLFYYPTRGPTQPPPHLAEAQSVWFASSDGTRLHGWFIPAQGAHSLPKQAATILQVHGNAGNIESHIGFAEHLPLGGFNLFIFDYRGYGRSEGSARRRGPLIADSHAALDALLAREDIDRGRIGLYGQSLGGSIALNVMADRPEIRAAVIESAFASWRDIAASALGGDSPGFVSRGLATLLIKDNYRPADAIGRIDRPILLVHGTADRTIPISHSRRLAEAAAAADLVELAGGDHNDLRATHPEIDQLTIDFFGAHLGGDQVPRRDP